jgi:hypothetical protein
MKKEAIGTKGIFVILVLVLTFTVTVFLAIGSAEVTELNVNPSVVLPGETLSISGKATPNEAVWITSSFVISLPVSDGKYSAEFEDIFFPPGEKKFSVTAENVEDIRISLGPLAFYSEVEYPLDGPLEATSGIATIAISVPITMGGFTVNIGGEKDVKVYGAAFDDATSVILTTDMAIKVTADKNGDFILDLDTEGVPLGKFSIAAGEKEKTVVQIVHTKPKPTPTPGPSHDRDKEPDISPTPKIIPTLAPTPSSSQKSSIGTTSSPSQKQTQTPEPTLGQEQTSTPESTPDQKQTATPEPSPSPPSRLIPGFNAFFAIAGLFTVAYLVLALRRK